MDQYALESAQNVLFDVSTMLHEFCLETKCADISKIKMEMFANKKYNKEIVSVWLVETLSSWYEAKLWFSQTIDGEYWSVDG